MNIEEIVITAKVSIFAIMILITLIKKRRQFANSQKEPRKLEIKEKQLFCQHCQEKTFFKREGLINTTWLSFFQMSFWNQSAHCFECCSCGYLHWFSNAKEKIL